MDLKIFPNTIMLLKVDRFEGFSNQSNDELVINITNGCNCNDYKLNNNIAVFSFWFRSRCNLGVFSSKFKKDMCDSLNHVLALCYHAYLLVQSNLLLH